MSRSVPEPADLGRGRAALARGDWQDAAAFLEAAVGADPSDPVAWEALGRAYSWLQESDRAIEARQHAYTLFRELGDDGASARVSLGLVWDFLEVRGERAVANGWRQRARRLLEVVPASPEHALLGVLDAYVTLEEDPAAAERHARGAVRVARQVGSADVELVALALQGLAMVTEGRVSRGLSLLDEAVAGATGREVTDPQWFYLTCCCMIDACDRVRDFGRSLEWCDRLREFAEQWRVQAYLTTCRVKYASALLWRGDWDVLKRELELARAELTATRPTAVPGALVRLAELRRRQGRREDAEALLARADPHPLVLAVRTALALDAGDAATAVLLVDNLLRRVPPTARTERATALELKVRAYAKLGQVDEARSAVDELDAIAGMANTPALRAAALAAAGVVAAAALDHDGAQRLFEDAVHLYASSGSRHEAARVRIELAGTLADLGRMRLAMTEASTALAALEAVGAEGEARRARLLLDRLGKPAAAHRALTRRQREVLGLVAQGLSDRDIAARLFLSEHTVHRHVANILMRLGVSSRSAAVARAVRGGIL
jgi:LuxR family transcriptional regulator, maltose regulon positive regulatory protein